ncbi:MAG: phosphatase PAP2 family protein [Candidatus Thorarchaeota archaeon]|jgi:membrane-associated phospholipid phosphatase
MFFDPTLSIDLRNLLPWAGELFRLITELGSEIIYIGMILIGFWTIKKREVIVLTFVMMATIVVNFWMKTLIANPRPDQSYWYTTDIDTPNYSTPSGHSQYSATFYSWLSLKVKTWWMLVVSITVTFLIGLSRIYLGVHYLGDVLLGWGMGIALAVVIFLFYQSIEEMLSKLREEFAYIGLFLVGLVLLIIQVVAFPTLPYGDNFGAYGGMIMGLAIGLPLEKRYVGFEISHERSQIGKLVARAVIGLVIVIALLLGLGLVLPSSDVLLRALRYIIIVNVGVFIWPLIFSKLNL